MNAQDTLTIAVCVCVCVWARARVCASRLFVLSLVCVCCAFRQFVTVPTILYLCVCCCFCVCVCVCVLAWMWLPLTRLGLHNTVNIITDCCSYLIITWSRWSLYPFRRAVSRLRPSLQRHGLWFLSHKRTSNCTWGEKIKFIVKFFTQLLLRHLDPTHSKTEKQTGVIIQPDGCIIC